ncbi:MAG TPA: ATPase, T2SS/T4P/T4SS family [Coriobacteriia bacterium]|nr:ATPase, T2SS/T4P/T4SS family [Coriobacteriia bacterium]
MSERVMSALVAAGKVTPAQVSAAETQAPTGRVAARVLLETGVLRPEDVTATLERALGVPRVDLSSYSPDAAALALVPAELARTHSVLPLFEIDSILTVALGDAAGIFELDALSDEIRMDVEAVLVEPEALREALALYYGDERDGNERGGDDDASPPVIEPAETPLPEVAAPTLEDPPETCVGEIDLDVLAVTDPGKVTALVTEILSHAVGRGASSVHLLPYKDDFFLAYRIGGRLENIASAPLSLQGPLTEGFKATARLDALPPFAPALGRARTRVCDADLVLTVSAVPTVSGQRVVISLAADQGVPRDLTELGMLEEESRALYAMVERGRGMVLICGPVAGGRSATYYALLMRAALAGRTAYSVERAVQYEIPAVAQVLVSPGSPHGTAAYLAAGLQQDTDVVAVDSLQSVDDVHRAVEAAGLGKLVIATFAGAGIVSGVRRLLDLGAEPASLAAALTFGVGQRLVRTNCPGCAQDEPSAIAGLIPGASPGLQSRAGSGCPQCGGTGFGGLSGLFEAVPFTEHLRAAVEDGADAGEIERRAIASGMRPMIVAGRAKVESGLVSAEELNRVMRFAESAAW